MSKEIPILFSTQMVQVLMAGKKTMTRRIVKQSHVLYQLNINKHVPSFFENSDWCKHGQPKDILWVRETWNKPFKSDQYNSGVIYKADYGQRIDLVKQYDPPSGWKPSIHMKKDYARIWLEVTSVRIERLQDISWKDAVAEGCEGYRPVQFEPMEQFRKLWETINGSESWPANPWVWVIEFKVLSTNGKPK